MNERYSRQILFREIGVDGQQKLLESRVLLVGCGALGASHAEMLARAGVGKLRIVDRDFVEYTNLQRQTLFSEDDAAERTPKAIAAKQRIAAVNSEIEVEAIIADVNHSNVEALINGCDLVIDGTDNFQVRYLVNDACVKLGTPWIYGAAVSSYGTTMTIIPGKTPCLRCVFDEMPDAGSAPTCDTAGVIMPIITTISAVQVAEALKLLIGKIDALHGSLMQFDLWANDRQSIKLVEPNPDCRTCGLRIFDYLDTETPEFSAALCGRNAVQIAPPHAITLDLDQLAERLQFVVSVNQNEYLLRFTSGEYEMTVFRDGRAIVKGTDDLAAARSMYARFVGS
ncbi:MAG TPA: ThiF family adenylyltransferase [Pyrinomonadaceae bacterium]|nr:ThiF family adenylyltransferase [Chloracidobacterium sp.]MBP9936950.1 ThiF family adenylyltransferase [Pyrinomonadaceae bacterium]MBK7802235.1 ThiF family adenylyltransferase [Chloracidobacterium sp.]MBK9437108.1 ThiF family adenylyltransferase [Chloracidobacterium sp.]MBL0239781.1 ThiF family adenylyltransferase [Chloracidobacterium sp.]